MTKHGGWPSTGFADRLREARERANLTQQELADRTHCSRHTVAKLEQGLQEPAWPLVLALAKALDVPVGTFASGPGGSQPDQVKPVQGGEPRRRSPAEVAAHLRELADEVEGLRGK